MRLCLKSKDQKYAIVLPLDGCLLRATWLNGCVQLIWESLLQLMQSSREACACVTEPPSQRQVFRLIHAKQNRQKAEANNNNTSRLRRVEGSQETLGAQTGFWSGSTCVWSFMERIMLKINVECLIFSFKSFILLCMTWSAVATLVEWQLNTCLE